MTTQEKLDLLLKQVESIKNEVLEIKDSQNNKANHWKNTKDEIIFSEMHKDLSIRCNNKSWSDYKKNGSAYSTPMYLSARGMEELLI